MGANSRLGLGCYAIACAVLGAALLASAQPAADESAAPNPASPEFFDQKIKPIFAEICTECHGEKKQESGLRLDSRAGFITGSKTGPIVVPGEPDASRMIAALRYSGEIKMPPDMKLFPEEVELLAEWVRSGAHWPLDGSESAAPPPVPAEPLADRLAAAKASHWAFQPVRMPELPAVSNEAWVNTGVDRFVLVTLDAKGLAPSPEADRRTLIRRLYYDLIGLPPSPANVDAFLADSRPDAYEQLVEGLLAMPQYGERWARHWLDVARYADTRGYVGTDDRFFPFSYTYRDYVIRAFNEDLPYDKFIVQQLAADKLDAGDDKRPLAAMGFLTLGRRFLNNTNDIIDDRIDVVSRGMLGLTVTCARCHDHKFDPIPSADYYSLYGVFRSSEEPGELPLIKEPDPANPLYQDYLKILGQKKDEVDAYISDIHITLVEHAHERVGDYLAGAYLARDIAENEPFLRLAKEHDLNHQLLRRWVDFLKAKADANDPIFAVWCALAKLPEPSFAQDAAGALTALKSSGVPLNTRIVAAFESAPASITEAAGRYGTLFTETDQKWLRLLADRVQIATDAKLPPNLPTVLPDPNDEALRQVMYGAGNPGCVSLDDAFDLSEVPVRERIKALRNNVTNHEATHHGRPDRAMALADAEKPFEPYIFIRGKEDSKGPEVPRRFLAVLSGGERGPFTQGSGRLELARNIASPDNPLTARVFVNRVWAHHFGKPLVATPSDFGLRSDPPSHPELLDYLARRFMDEGWSVKNLHRMMVNSAAYRQASFDRPEGGQADPDNRLLWRQNRRRVDFEALRDSLLALGGNLDPAVGGPAVEIFSAPFAARRTVYGLIDRQNLPGVFRSFDFATPDAHAPLRYETVVPQQSLFLMNSPFVVEQARALAAREDVIASADTDARTAAIFRLVYQRDPRPDELALAHKFLARNFDTGPEPPPPSPWKYGYGGFDRLTAKVPSFTPFTVFENDQWRVGDAMPDPKFAWVSVGSRGGHPGRTPETSAIRRWVAPFDGVIRISGRLRHGDEHGDGITGLIVSSQFGLLGEWHVLNSVADMVHEHVSVSAGETIDFVAACGENDGYDSFEWAQRVRYVEVPKDPNPYRTEWEARADFSGPPLPPPAPLGAWEQLAQVLLLSNELMYVD